MFANATTYPPFPETEGGGGRCIDQVSGIHVNVEIGSRLPFPFRGVEYRDILVHILSPKFPYQYHTDGKTGEVHRGVPRHEHQPNT